MKLICDPKWRVHHRWRGSSEFISSAQAIILSQLSKFTNNQMNEMKIIQKSPTSERATNPPFPSNFTFIINSFWIYLYIYECNSRKSFRSSYFCYIYWVNIDMSLSQFTQVSQEYTKYTCFWSLSNSASAIWSISNCSLDGVVDFTAIFAYKFCSFTQRTKKNQKGAILHLKY